MPKQLQLTPTEALLLVLDQVDYTQGACSPTEMVSAALSTDVIRTCRETIARERARTNT